MRTARYLLLFVAILGVPGATYADVVTDWNNAALEAIRVNRTPPPIASRVLAIMHAAIYDAVNGISRTHEPYRVASAVPRSASKEASASAAARKVLSVLFPDRVSIFDTLHATILAGLPAGPQREAGLAWGVIVADAILAWRSTDNSDALVSSPAYDGIGSWQPTLPAFAPYALPQWGYVEPFAMPTSSFFRSSGPPALTSVEYAVAYNQVKTLGAAMGSMRTPEQDVIAAFWADGAGTETPPGHWNRIAQGLVARSGQGIDQNARLFSLINIAMADAAICAWDAKYFFHNWRPVTAIRNADVDGNPATEVDATWTPFLVTPPFPDYVSGHSTFSGAASVVLAMFYGSDDVIFTTGSDFLPAVRRTFMSFSAAADEAALSRLYGGIHFAFSNLDGLQAGRAIGEWTFTHVLLEKRDRSRK